MGAWLGTREGRVTLMGADARPQADGGLAVTVLSEGAHGHKDNKNSICEDVASLRAFQSKCKWQYFGPVRINDTFKTRDILRGRNCKAM